MIRENATTHDTWLGIELRIPSRWGLLAAGVLIGLVLGTAVATVAARGLDAWRAAQEPAALAQEWPTRPLPQEWRWSPSTVKVDHMFRKQR